MKSAFVCDSRSVIRGVLDARTISKLSGNVDDVIVDVVVADVQHDGSSSWVMTLASASGHKIHDLPWPRCEANLASKMGR